MRRNDESYYRGRAIQEQIAAQNATSGAAREVHDQLAAMYRFRVAMLSRGSTKCSESVRDELLPETV
jgi:hypothetical protein